MSVPFVFGVLAGFWSYQKSLLIPRIVRREYDSVDGRVEGGVHASLVSSVSHGTLRVCVFSIHLHIVGVSTVESWNWLTQWSTSVARTVRRTPVLTPCRSVWTGWWDPGNQEWDLADRRVVEGVKLAVVWTSSLINSTTSLSRGARVWGMSGVLYVCCLSDLNGFLLRRQGEQRIKQRWRSSTQRSKRSRKH